MYYLTHVTAVNVTTQRKLVKESGNITTLIGSSSILEVRTRDYI